MSSFSARRKARVINVDEDDADAPKGAALAGQESLTENASQPSPTVKFSRKPFRQSGLRKIINISEDIGTDEPSSALSTPKGPSAEEEDEGPVVVRPTMNRPGASKKKRAVSSRLSFGPGQETADAPATPRKAILNQQAIGNAASRNAATSQRLPLRRFNDDEDDRPRYDKEYLAELQSSTPKAPANISSTEAHEDPMELDESELEGAMIVDGDGYPTSFGPPAETTNILSATEIAERKQRRARLAHEQDFISMDDDDYESGKKTQPESRLVREDEDLGEGFDDFVEDGGLSLGKKAEREAKARRRREMAEQIQMAEGNSEDESDDSDAERRAAFEAAQSRSGMDGLTKPAAQSHDTSLQVPAKITPLPELDSCLERLRATLQGMEATLQSKQSRVNELMAERESIVEREKEVQGLLDEAGKKYKSALGGGNGSSATMEAGQSPGVQLQSAALSELAVERGLESFGTTPNRRPDTGEDD